MGGGASTGGSSTGGAGSGGMATGGGSGLMDPCARGTPDPKPAASSVSGYGVVELDTAPDNPVLSLTTTLVVPPEPPATGTLFLWPGLQPLPGGAHYLPIDNGVLQPVLTWGPTCAPNAPSSPYASWWVSAQYVNTVGQAPGFTGCQGGNGMTIPVGDTLIMAMTLSGTTWSQAVTSMNKGTMVSFAFDLQGQSQNRALFIIEGYSSAPTVPVQFGPTVVTSSPSRPLRPATCCTRGRTTSCRSRSPRSTGRGAASPRSPSKRRGSEPPDPLYPGPPPWASLLARALLLALLRGQAGRPVPFRGPRIRPSAVTATPSGAHEMPRRGQARLTGGEARLRRGETRLRRGEARLTGGATRGVSKLEPETGGALAKIAKTEKTRRATADFASFASFARAPPVSCARAPAWAGWPGTCPARAGHRPRRRANRRRICGDLRASSRGTEGARGVADGGIMKHREPGFIGWGVCALALAACGGALPFTPVESSVIPKDVTIPCRGPACRRTWATSSPCGRSSTSSRGSRSSRSPGPPTPRGSRWATPSTTPIRRAPCRCGCAGRRPPTCCPAAGASRRRGVEPGQTVTCKGDAAQAGGARAAPARQAGEGPPGQPSAGRPQDRGRGQRGLHRTAPRHRGRASNT